MANRDEQALKKIISGEDHSFNASLLRTLTRCIEPFYTCAMATRNQLYNSGIKKTHFVSTPVISIGNLTTGGTGKTPIVIHLAQQLHKNGLHVGIILRGYHGNQTGGSDEATIMKNALPADVIIEVNPNRVAAAQKLESQTDVILLDDGFQHRRLGRTLDLVLIDATAPFGFNHVLPRGLLRESKRNLPRAHAVIITRASQIPPSALDQLQSEIQKYHGRPPIATCDHTWDGYLDQNDQPIEINDQNVFAFCGIGNPSAFFTQAAESCNLTGQHAFPDHHAYTPNDITQLIADTGTTNTPEALPIFLTTEKDWVKIQPLLKTMGSPPNLTIIRPTLRLNWTTGQDTLMTMINNAVNQ